jgi:hypothetical protein
MTTRPCDSCARWYPIDQLVLTRDTDTWQELMLCFACYEWRTGVEAERGGR